MSTNSAAKLYTPQLLSLATSLADYPLNPDFPMLTEARSRTCGSAIKLGLELDANGLIKRVGMQVSACAIGQSSAAIFAAHATGRDNASIIRTEETIKVWLERDGPMPDWPDFDALAAAKDHPARHGALLLVWKAAREALSSSEASS